MKLIKQLPKIDRPREKLVRFGVKNLKSTELIAILFRTGYKDKNAIQLAEFLLSKFPLSKFEKLDYQTLLKMKGIGSTKACSLLAAIELSKRLRKKTNNLDLEISSINDVILQFSSLKTRKKETLQIILMDARSCLIGLHTVASGTLNSNAFHPRDIFEPAISQNALSVIMGHNHPSGDAAPSVDDVEMTKQMAQAGEVLGIKLVDHVIISRDSYFSFSERGIL
jgi:DNA repair protein RadC